jgi:pimeloyl-ACP methyl ester carboxylesterase
MRLALLAAAALMFAMANASRLRALWRRIRTPTIRAAFGTRTDAVTLPDGVMLPCETAASVLPCNVVVAHGLGDDPAAKSHKDDISTALVKATFELLEGSYSCTFYTARGHGLSSGWEAAAALDVSMFHWERLAKDMLVVADTQFGDGSCFVAIGNSMGAATALQMAAAQTRVQGLVMIRTPTAWETREARSPRYVELAAALQAARPGTAHHLPLLGAAETDLPPKAEAAFYSRVRCPVLILSHGDDDAHPMEMGEAMKALMPHATLVRAKNEQQARQKWPAELARFLKKVQGDGRVPTEMSRRAIKRMAPGTARPTVRPRCQQEGHGDSMM